MPWTLGVTGDAMQHGGSIDGDLSQEIGEYNGINMGLQMGYNGLSTL